jgi:hypothetical protein
VRSNTEPQPRLPRSPFRANFRIADDTGVIAWQLEEATLTLRVLLPRVRCGLFDQSCNLLRPGYVDRVTGAGDFDLVAVGSCGIPPFEIGIDGSVRSRYQRPAWFASPRSCGDYGFEIVAEV